MEIRETKLEIRKSKLENRGECGQSKIGRNRKRLNTEVTEFAKSAEKRGL
jgi:hypothetical protein